MGTFIHVQGAISLCFTVLLPSTQYLIFPSIHPYTHKSRVGVKFCTHSCNICFLTSWCAWNMANATFLYAHTVYTWITNLTLEFIICIHICLINFSFLCDNIYFIQASCWESKHLIKKNVKAILMCPTFYWYHTHLVFFFLLKRF